jgi:hypothetical protein
MKHIFKISSYILGFLLVFTSCDDVETIELNPGPSNNAVVSLSASNLVLIEDDADSEVLTVSWREPVFGFDAAATYKIMIDFEDGDFSAPQVIPVGSNLSKIFKGNELNGKLLSLGLVPFEESNVDIKVETTLSASQKMISEPVTLTVTAYSSLLDLSTTWGVVGSATPGGWGNPDILDLPFYTSSESGVYVAYVTLRDGFIKFRENNAWTNNYGDNGGDGTLEAGGADIAVTSGTYLITFDTNNLTYTIEDYSWGLVGSATTNGWDGPDMMLQYNSFQNNWVAVVTLADGEVKFRFNNDWGLNYGDTGADGSLEVNGDNIAVSAGHYLVTMDLNTLTYTLEEMDVWGLVGDATANGWDGPNEKFVPDFGINEGYYYINGAVLSAGEIKVRQNDAWGVNYGDDGNDGTLELNGANIPVTAGTYNIVLNFSVDPPTIAMYPW